MIAFVQTAIAQNTFPPTGNAGIGTTSPNANLQINGGFSDNNCTNYTGQHAMSILWSKPSLPCLVNQPSGTIPDAFRIVEPDPTYPFPPYYIEKPIMVLNGVGSLGLGTAPDNAYRLKVLGSAYFHGNANVKGDINLSQFNSTYTPTITANNSNKGLNIFSNTSSTDGAYLEMYGKDHSDATRKGSIHFVSHGSTGEGIGFFNYDPATTNWRRTMTITNDNKVYIGDQKPVGGYVDYRLGVDGDIVCKRAVVQTSSWADFVFDDDYVLPSIPQLEAYITVNNHLPDVPTTAEVVEKGVDVGSMNKVLLQKVEELTLYVIDLQKQIDNLKKLK